MRIEVKKVTQLVIREAENLDPISVVLEDYGKAQGKITVECCGDAWSHYWSSMGDGVTLAEFLLTASDEYTAGKLHTGPGHITDFEKITQDVVKAIGGGITISNDSELAWNEEALVKTYGIDWFMDVPQKTCPRYVYLRRIVVAIQEGIQMLKDSTPGELFLVAGK